MNDPRFWEDKTQSAEKLKQLSDLKEKLKSINDLVKDVDVLKEIEINEENQNQITKEFEKIERNTKSLDLKTKFTGKYDKDSALVYVYSGAGGVDAQDWASILLKMYQGYCHKSSWSCKILDQSFGEQDGTKSAVLEVIGLYAYGYLKKESGVHRLVRLSPFSAKSLRHTSFALVQVLPESEKEDLKISPDELKIETYKSSGPGGQYLQKTETAIRITHIPTKLTVCVQSERSQLQNKERAMKVLVSQLRQKMEQEKVNELSQLKPSLATGIEWGNQIRSYILHPYKLVKDHRTEVEFKDTDKVLEGNLDIFIQAELES